MSRSSCNLLDQSKIRCQVLENNRCQISSHVKCELLSSVRANFRKSNIGAATNSLFYYIYIPLYYTTFFERLQVSVTPKILFLLYIYLCKLYHIFNLFANCRPPRLCENIHITQHKKRELPSGSPFSKFRFLVTRTHRSITRLQPAILVSLVLHLTLTVKMGIQSFPHLSGI